VPSARPAESDKRNRSERSPVPTRRSADKHGEQPAQFRRKAPGHSSCKSAQSGAKSPHNSDTPVETIATKHSDNSGKSVPLGGWRCRNWSRHSWLFDLQQSVTHLTNMEVLVKFTSAVYHHTTPLRPHKYSGQNCPCLVTFASACASRSAVASSAADRPDRAAPTLPPDAAPRWPAPAHPYPAAE